MQSNGNSNLNDLIPKWTCMITVQSQNWWSTPVYRGAMKLEEKTLLWMPAKTQKLRNKKTQNTKKKKERTKKKKKSVCMKNQDPHQARHPSSWKSSSIWRCRSVSCYFGSRSLYATRKMLKLSVGEASVLVWPIHHHLEDINKPKTYKNKIKRNLKPSK